MKIKNSYILLIFAFLLILFVIFSNKIGFHDSAEYISIAKYFVGINNIDLFSAHSLLYPLVISLPLKIWPAFITIKLINILWIFLIGVILLLWLKNKTAFFLFAFSPLTWIISIQTTPILPASFCFLLGFIFFKKQTIKYHLWFSGIFLGLSCSFYDPMLLISLIFMLVYFWDKNFKDSFIYIISIIIGFLPRMILDFYLFKMPLYSLIRYSGANLVILLGMNPYANGFNLLSNLKILLSLIIISPFIFRLYKIKFSDYKKEIIFLSFITIFFFLVGIVDPKYFLIIAPIIILLLSKILTKTDLRLSYIISIVLIIFFTWSYFTATNEILIANDLKKIFQENQVDYIISPNIETLKFATFYWQNKPYFIWFQDFEASLENKSEIRSYNLDFYSKIPLRDKLKISAFFNRFENKTYSDYILVTENKQENIDNFKLKKCYELLCVYEK